MTDAPVERVLEALEGLAIEDGLTVLALAVVRYMRRSTRDGAPIEDLLDEWSSDAWGVWTAELGVDGDGCGCEVCDPTGARVCEACVADVVVPGTAFCVDCTPTESGG